MTFVSPHAVLGGAEAVLSTLLSDLGPAGVAGIVVLQDGPLVHELRRAGHDVTVLPTGARAGMALSALRLRRVLRRQRPSLVHANGVKAALVASAAVAGTRTPLLWMKHDTAGDGRLGALVGARSDLVVGVSDTVLRTFADARRPPRCVTVYNGVPERKVDRRAARALATAVLGLDDDTELVLLAARMCHGKGQHELLGAAPAILAARPRARFAFVGPDDPAFPGHRARLQAQAAALGLADAVRFLPHREDVTMLMAGSDVVVVPSVLDDVHGWREGFGLVPVEAMQAGTPVVAYASGALPEVLDDAAVLVPEGDRVALGAAVAGVLEDGEAAGDLVRRGRALVAARYSRERSVRLLGDQYRMLAGCRS